MLLRGGDIAHVSKGGKRVAIAIIVAMASLFLLPFFSACTEVFSSYGGEIRGPMCQLDSFTNIANVIKPVIAAPLPFDPIRFLLVSIAFFLAFPKLKILFEGASHLRVRIRLFDLFWIWSLPWPFVTRRSYLPHLFAKRDP